MPCWLKHGTGCSIALYECSWDGLIVELRPRVPQGRFSGRLETKEDEKRLVEECKLLGPLLVSATALHD